MLCSGHAETIRLAGSLMEQSDAESREPHYPASDDDDMPLLHKVAYSKVVQLVLSAAREYFDSSATLTDPCMDLARYTFKHNYSQNKQYVSSRSRALHGGGVPCPFIRK